MHRAVLVTGALFVAVGLGLFGVKTLRFGIPVAPTENLGPWQVELRISARGEGARGSVRALLPSTEGGQVIFDERSSGDRLQFSIRERAGEPGAQDLLLGGLGAVRDALVVAPIAQLSFVLTGLLAVLVLRERLTFAKLAGVGFAAASIGVFALSS